jgi:hypothetical protein
MTNADLNLLMSENVIDLETARLYHIPGEPSVATVDRWIKSGQIRVFRAGQRRRFTSVEEVERFLQKCNSTEECMAVS